MIYVVCTVIDHSGGVEIDSLWDSDLQAYARCDVVKTHQGGSYVMAVPLNSVVVR